DLAGEIHGLSNVK
nr:RecName: Full=Isocitrate dehydrogenase [NADP] cytoplasmic; Short=IDH; AltName: Full=Cytosolic NADP-isocitrate dehydrogenase; AltName: Full=IDP; AltName: Full=NADP(+)-specific ICDH; AltName: Full=Oxalosuccinate decarboxylase [Sus scrofa]